MRIDHETFPRLLNTPPKVEVGIAVDGQVVIYASDEGKGMRSTIRLAPSQAQSLGVALISAAAVSESVSQAPPSRAEAITKR